jgi:uncharacterized protein
VERILFAATKADHLHHTQHPQLTAIMEALVRDAKDRADFAGARTAAMSIASLRATTEDRIDHEGRRSTWCAARSQGRASGAAFYPGEAARGPRAASVARPERGGEMARRGLFGDGLRAPAGWC